MNNEIWKPIPEYLGYEASNHGRIRSWRIKGGMRSKPLVLSASPRTNGYLQAGLRREDGQLKNCSVHRVIAITFIAVHDSQKNLVLHKDGNKANNNVSNLYWGDTSDNVQDAIKHGTWVVGSKNGRAKINEDQALEIHARLKAGESGTDISKDYDVSKYLISRIKNGKAWRHVK